jgi:hypothetical protein
MLPRQHLQRVSGSLLGQLVEYQYITGLSDDTKITATFDG